MSGTILVGQARTAPRKSAAGKAIDRLLAEQTSRSRADWATRHPDRARQERTFRKQQAQMREAFGHKRNGTPETHQKASQIRQGAMARLFQSGAIDADQLAAASMIALVHERIAAAVGVRTASLETRVDRSKHGDAFYEKIGAVWAEMAYSEWRARLGPSANPILAVIVDDLGIAAAAVRHRMSVRRLRALLVQSLDQWWSEHADARRMVSAADLAAAHAGLV